jgi:hypothetical protein
VEAGQQSRLTIELVPQSCWFSNVRKQVPPREWDRIRRQVYERANHRCEVCGGRGTRHPVECHEVWEYDEAAGVQRLLRMIALCPACHEVKHIGLAGVKGRGEIAEAHLATVNGWTPDTAARHVSEAFAVWRARSRQSWSLDISSLEIYGVEPAIIAAAGEPSAEDRSKAVARDIGKRARPGNQSLS